MYRRHSKPGPTAHRAKSGAPQLPCLRATLSPRLCSVGKACVACPPGKFNPHYGPSSKACVVCSVGTRQPDSGMTECAPCPDDQSSLAGSTACFMSCKRGKYAVTWGRRLAGAAKENKYCNSCPAGKYGLVPSSKSSATGAAKLISLLTGSGKKPADGICLPCTMGQVQAQSGQPSCAPCPVGESWDASLHSRYHTRSLQ